MKGIFTQFFADTLTDILRIKGISQTQFAKDLGIKQNTVSQWASGKREPNFDMLMRICYYLDVTPNDILSYPRAKNLMERIDKLKETKGITHEAYMQVLIDWYCETLNK